VIAPRRLVTGELEPATAAGLRALFESAWPGTFTPEDWEHSLGGVHFLLEDDGAILAHASIVPRTLETAGHSLATGYVEAVATRPERQGEGLGTQVMRAATEHVRESYELGALSTHRLDFYRRLGWIDWSGPTAVRTDVGTVRTPDEDGAVLVLLTPSSPDLDPAGALSCDWRPGDVW
jgi:aminoglycoside 2'-N-acetyltransferase I